MSRKMSGVPIVLFLLLTSFSAHPGWGAAPALLGKLVPNDADGNDSFGTAISISGNTALIGAGYNDSKGVDSGAAYIFELDSGGSWNQAKKIIALDGAKGDLFGYSVALDGDIAVIGAFNKVDLHTASGVTYIFERNEGGADQWGQVARIAAPDLDQYDNFGIDVAISGSTAMIGAWREDANANESGAVYVFERDQGGVGNWGQVAKLKASDPDAEDHFGFAVSLDGDTAIVGASSDDGAATDAGAAYVFGRHQGGADNWGQISKITAADAEADASFGSSVFLDGTIAIVSAHFDDGDDIDVGAAYIFERDEGGADNWGQVARLDPGNPTAGAAFGYRAVAVEGTTALVGAYRDDDGGIDIGSAYIFERDQGGAKSWGQVARITNPDPEAQDRFGSAVAFAGTTAFVAAFADNEGGTDAGAAYLFDIDFGPELSVPTSVPVVAAPVPEAVIVPVHLATRGEDLAATAFSVDFDADCLAFDTTDGDLDGRPDAISFHTPADFDPTVLVDLGDADGEIDISILDLFPPFASLADGPLVSITFTPTCAPAAPATILASVGFSADPLASFSDPNAQSVPGAARDGSVELFTGTRGDCNADGTIDAADLVACILELFDGDGNDWRTVAGGTYVGDPVGCDANADALVDAGDLTCKNRLIFGLDCAPAGEAGPGSSETSDAPWLGLAATSVVSEDEVVVEIELDPASHALGATVFALDFDQERLAFDPTDADSDGVPDSVQFFGTPVTHRRASFDAERVDSELHLLMADLVPAPRPLAEGLLVRIELRITDPALGEGTSLEGAVRFATEPSPSFGNIDGRSVGGQAGYGPGPFFADGFESGSTDRWSATAD